MDISFIDNFKEIQKIFAKKNLKIDADFGSEIKDVEKAIGFQFWLNHEISMLFQKESKLPSKIEQLFLIYMFRNAHYLLGCLLLCKQGLLSPCYNNLRTVYETILKMYYLFEYPHEAELVWAYYDDKLDPKQEAEMKNKKWFGHSFLIDKLYSDNTKQSLQKAYKEVSQKAHPNVYGAFLDARLPSQLDLISIRDCIRSMLTFSYFNSAALLEVFLDILDSQTRDRIKDQLLDIMASLDAGTEKYPILAPDKPNLPKKLKIDQVFCRI